MSNIKSKAGEKSKGAVKASSKSISKTKSSSLLGKKSAKRRRLERAVNKMDIDKLGSLPHSYGTNAIFLAAQDPRWLFTYWDIEISRHPGGPCSLRLEDETGAIEQEISVPFETRNWYVPVKTAGKNYTIELGFYRGKTWKSLARSTSVATPRDRISESASFDFATIPIHIGFQRLVETITNSMSFDQNLVPALAELQRAVGHGGSSSLLLQDKERAILATLLGKEFLEELSSALWGSEELHLAIYLRLQERLGSGELGEILARLQLGHAESSLFSMFSKLEQEMGGSSGNFTSSGLAERMASGLSSWLSHWSIGAPSGLAALTSGELSSGAFSQGELSSWSGGTSATMAWNLSSWSGNSATLAETLSSWNQLSSWLSAVGSSWSGMDLSSFEQAALSSWSSSALSSWESGALSSWGSSENSFGLAAVQGDLQFSAEITVRGQTHPQNRVLVDGVSVEVQNDGSFNHKVVVGGGGRTVPIEAFSPDGRSTQRAAILLQSPTI
jgi:hypothetical protein